jgi:hypothetical protein
MRFCFDSFDVDHSNTIDESEFIQLCKNINNSAPSFPANFKNALEKFDVNAGIYINYLNYMYIIVFIHIHVYTYIYKGGMYIYTYIYIYVCMYVFIT